jgi:hypothetical protein
MTSEKYSELESEVRNTLQKLKELTEAQLAAFRARDQAEFIRLDKELEKTMGAKNFHVVSAYRDRVDLAGTVDAFQPVAAISSLLLLRQSLPVDLPLKRPS